MKKKNESIILASQSPRRQELLKKITDDFLCIPADIDETVPCGIKMEKAPEYLALKKAEFIAEKYPRRGNTGDGSLCCWHFHPTRNHPGYASTHIWYYE